MTANLQLQVTLLVQAMLDIHHAFVHGSTMTPSVYNHLHSQLQFNLLGVNSDCGSILAISLCLQHLTQKVLTASSM